MATIRTLSYFFILMSLSFYSKAQTPQNIIFILSDDHRYDYMSFHPNSPDFIQTPGLDRMADEGVHLANAFVTTSLCSPSRASILTGQYAFRHGAVDNNNPMKPETVFFPEQLQKEGYETAFFGKWHIGEASDDPKPGFGRWVSFRGQGVYFDPMLNIDGERRQIKGYITDILTDFAMEWMDEGRDKRKPFFMYLSHKAVHAEFEPAKRHEGNYSEKAVSIPSSMKNVEQNYEGKPHWVKEQRYGWHGVDFMYHHQADHPQNVEEISRRYGETLLAVDESVTRILDYLESTGLAENTVVIYMGDNGFLLGEHGLIDKRHAYEESMRVPLIAWAPGLIEPGTTIEKNILNIDIAPTFLELGGTRMPQDWKVDGRSFLSILRGESPSDWRNNFKYQYYWEYAFPHTPTTYAIRSARYKYIFYHGVWDKNEFYDLETDPREMHNLIDAPGYQEKIRSMKKELFDFLSEEEATDVKFRRPGEFSANERKLH